MLFVLARPFIPCNKFTHPLTRSRKGDEEGGMKSPPPPSCFPPAAGAVVVWVLFTLVLWMMKKRVPSVWSIVE